MKIGKNIKKNYELHIYVSWNFLHIFFNKDYDCFEHLFEYKLKNF